jgi:hypothetical protein
MNRKYCLRLPLVFCTRAMVALTLVAAFACAVIPLASASGNVCKLECCAGRATHAAGSCMNGTCHAAVKIQRKTIRRTITPPADELCGLKSLSHRFHVTAIPAQSNAPTENQQSTSTVGQRCEPNCGSCSGGSNSFKDKTAVAAVRHARPAIVLSLINSRPTALRDAQTLEYSPRGPPSTLFA